MIMFIPGCYSVNISASSGEHPISMSYQPEGDIIKQFEIERTVHHLIGGLVTLNDVNISHAIDEEIKAAGGSRAVNVKIKYSMPIGYAFISYITFSIYNPFLVEITGDIVK